MARLPKPWYRAARKAWFVIINGVQHNLGPEKKEAHRRFHQLMREPIAKRVPVHTLASIIDQFLEWVHKNRAAATYRWHRDRLQHFIRNYPDLMPEALKPFHVTKWANADNLSITTRRNNLRAVKRCMRWAKEEGYIDDHPVCYLKVPAGTSRDVSIRPEQFEQFLSHVSDQTFADLVITAWETGCRPQEILKVTARHVDVENCRWVFQSSEAKGKRAVRVVYLTEKALEITKRLMEKHPIGQIFRNSREKPWTVSAANCAFRRIRARMGMAEFRKNGAITEEELANFIANKIKPTRRTNGKQVPKSESEIRWEARRKLRLRKACQYAPQYSLYALRHSFGTNALMRGLDALTVAVLMGHRDPSMLARV